MKIGRLVSLAENCFMVLSLLFCTGGVVAVLLFSESEGESAAVPDFSASRQIFLVIAFIAFVLVLPHWKRVLYYCIKDKIILSFVIFSFLSVFWSVVPDITLRRTFSLVATTILGAFFGVRFTLRQQLRLLACMFGLAVFLSFVFALILPKYGIMTGIHAGAWRGIYVHKNVLGKYITLGTSVFWLLAIHEKSYRRLYQLGFIFSLALIFLSTSISSLAITCLLLSTATLLKVLRWNYKLATSSITFSLSAAVILFAAAATNLGILLGTFGRSSNLSGRTVLWSAVVDNIKQHPWLGYGYSGFWFQQNSGAMDVWRVVKWPAPNAHNGFLDLWLELGLIGLMLLLLGLLIVFVNSVRWFQISQTAEGSWPFLFLLYTLMSNLSESSLLGPNSFFWVLYVGLSFGLIREFKKQRFQPERKLVNV